MMFSHVSGPAAETLRTLRRSAALRHVRFSLRGRGACDKLIIGIAQVHPVLSGRFEGFQARRIASIQAEIFTLCLNLYDACDVRSFGQEGLSGEASGRLPQEFLQQMHASESGVKALLRDAARRWRMALHGGNAEQAERHALALNALTVLQALKPDVTVFPIEQADVHGAIGEAVRQLQAEIRKAQSAPAFHSFRSKGGKGLTKEEYDAATVHQQLVKAYNATLAHPERDRAILREVFERASKPVTVFVLGTGHRSGMLTLAAQELPAGCLFAWAEPPSLWLWKALLHRVGWGLLVLSLVMGYWLFVISS